MAQYTNRPKGSGTYIFKHDLPIVRAYVELLKKTDEFKPRMDGHGLIEIQVGNNFYFGGKAVYVLAKYVHQLDDCPERTAFIELAKDYGITIE